MTSQRDVTPDQASAGRCAGSARLCRSLSVSALLYFILLFALSLSVQSSKNFKNKLLQYEQEYFRIRVRSAANGCRVDLEPVHATPLIDNAIHKIHQNMYKSGYRWTK